MEKKYIYFLREGGKSIFSKVPERKKTIAERVNSNLFCIKKMKGGKKNLRGGGPFKISFWQPKIFFFEGQKIVFVWGAGV